MKGPNSSPSNEGIGVSLVEGDATTRRSRQIMLRSAGYDVRSYATCAALLADPRARDYPCIIVDMETEEVDCIGLLRQMRASGWRGKGILLDGIATGNAFMQDAEMHGDKVYERSIGDGSLLAAVAASIYRGWAGWNAI